MMPPPSERRPGQGGEQSAAIIPLTDSQRQLAQLIRTNPAGAFAEMERRLTTVLGTNRPAKIGQTEVNIVNSIAFGRGLILSFPIDDATNSHLSEFCGNTEGLSTALRDDLLREQTRTNWLLVMGVEPKTGLGLTVFADSYGQETEQNHKVSPEVFAALVMRLEPQGIGPDLEERDGPTVADERTAQYDAGQERAGEEDFRTLVRQYSPPGVEDDRSRGPQRVWGDQIARVLTERAAWEARHRALSDTPQQPNTRMPNQTEADKRARWQGENYTHVKTRNKGKKGKGKK